MKAVVVLDVGKTMSKLTLWSAGGELLARKTRSNERVEGPGYAALDASGIESWLIEALRDFAQASEIEAIIPVGHGAAAAIVRDGRLSLPPMDYETSIDAGERRAYDAARDPFSSSGSPALPDGLNLGAQLNHLEAEHPGALESALIVLWPQYWAWVLSGVAASEMTSLGCHTDLWLPAAKKPSGLAIRRGWSVKLPPLRKASDVLGPITPEIARRTGLAPCTRVHCGLHDSNAALVAARAFPEIGQRESTVLSTGTWFVAMRSPAPAAEFDIKTLPEDRDCLVNVDAFGRAVPSSRFMGGRELETLTGIDTRRIDTRPDQADLVAAVATVVEEGSMVLPTFAAGVGPYPNARGRWIGMPHEQNVRRAAVSLYGALVADASLDLIGARERILVEGRFGEAEVFVRGLASLRRGTEVYVANSRNDVSFGALRLINPSLEPPSSLKRVEPLEMDLSSYRSKWRHLAEQLEIAA